MTETARPPLHLAVALDGAGWHPAAWREPEARPADLLSAGYWGDLVTQTERGLLDFVTFEDSLSLQSARRYAPDGARSIRSGDGAIQFPTPDEARAHSWTDQDRELVADRVATQFVGSPGQVADQLEQLRDATGADELIITTITHDHADRVRSYELLAREWNSRG